ncbi:DMT family transporter [Paenibacillus sacheonensis]|uniref:EamA family transporter n=1 Tax=Paenibacillus sacheonensis TaxID=742054 RepID=A0A7X4YPT5_9BACL|nr:DMT family transporter [Paenibacillus sacheonensis]MBM7566118.1 drug/metabolite transporter (DMT)-like permease [Paenibacillus sacheonensis]NBC70331.1 EamA family transporter [Paenibacillus sacheonensis]
MEAARQRTVYGLALLYAVIIGFAFLFTKQAMVYTNPVDMLAFRFTLSFLVLALPVAAGRVKLGLPGGDWRRIVPIGLLYPALFFGFQAYGLMVTTSSEAGIFQATTPVFTLVLASALLHERTSRIQKTAVFCSVGGVIFIMAMSGASVNGTSFGGIALLLASTFALSLYGVLVRRWRGEFTPFQMTYVMMTVGCVVFDGSALGRHAYAGTLGGVLEPFAHGGFIASLLYIALLSSVVSSMLSNYVLSRIEAYKMSLFINLGTFVSIVAGVAFEGDRLAYYHVIGALLIIGGVLGVHGRKRKPRQAAMEVEAG